MQRTVALLCLFVSLAVAHSWLGCSDYRITSPADEKVFNPANCKAYGRNWKSLGNPGGIFGLDNGYNYQTSSANCRDPLVLPYSSGYSATYDMATYTVGQNVCMAWPAKNHVAATCDNANIPDAGLVIYVSKPNPTANPDVASLTVVKAFPRNTVADKLVGFQHCPDFCNNRDKATCTGCFTVPNLQVGATYTFIWAWSFNGPQDVYSNCWEAQIKAGGNGGNTGTNPPITATGECLEQCQELCGEKSIATCDCSNGFSASCESSSSSTLMISGMMIVSVLMCMF